MNIYLRIYLSFIYNHLILYFIYEFRYEIDKSLLNTDFGDEEMKMHVFDQYSIYNLFRQEREID